MSTTDPTTTLSPAPPRRLVIRDVALLDATGRGPEGRGDVLVEDGVIARIAYRSAEVARAAGVAIASGSDVVGSWQGRRGEELVYKARALGAHEAIISATRTNAGLSGLADRLGTIEERKAADIILVRSEPLLDISLLADPENVVVVVESGVVVKDADGRARG